MLRLRGPVLASSALVVLLHACSSDHGVLKQKPPSTGGSAGDAAVEVGSDASADAADGDATADAPKDVFVEPPGEAVLTVLHGVVDAPRIALCFAKVEAGVPDAPTGSPLPASGLAFGEPMVLASIPGFDWDVDDIQPIVVTGDFSLLAGKTCGEVLALAASLADAGAADAGTDAGDASTSDASLDASDASDDGASELPPPPPARALALPVLPAGTLSGGYSNLLVAAGCMGGPGFTDGSEAFICGQTYTPTTPTLGPVLVQLSRVTDATSVGLSFVNASVSSEGMDLISAAPEGSSFSDIYIAYDTVFGAISPKPPLFGHDKASFGSPFGAAELQIFAPGATTPSHTQAWSEALAASGLSEVKDGRSYAVVLVGPRPPNPEMKWWNGPRLVAIPTDPTN